MSIESEGIEPVSSTVSLLTTRQPFPDASHRATPSERVNAAATAVWDSPCSRIRSVMVLLSSLCWPHFWRRAVTISRSDSAWMIHVVHGRVWPNRWMRWQAWIRSLNFQVTPTKIALFACCRFRPCPSITGFPISATVSRWRH